MILVLRGQRVILDRDLARLYGVATRDLNKAGGRNIERFPDDFMLQLGRDEFQNLKFQSGTSSWGAGETASPDRLWHRPMSRAWTGRCC